MAEELEKVGLFIDEFDKIRIIDPAVYTQANDLKENYKVFDDSKLYLRILIWKKEHYFHEASLNRYHLPFLSTIFNLDVKGLQQTMDSIIKTLSDLGSNVDKEKMIAIGLRNSLKSMTKNRETQQQKLQVKFIQAYIWKYFYFEFEYMFYYHRLW